MATPSIYIACGGSGLKTLESLTTLISQDQDLRYTFSKHIYYVLIDTEEKQLDKTEKLVRDLIPNLDKDNVRKIQITQGATSLEPLVKDAFRAAASDAADKEKKGLENLKKHWWFNEKSDLPFMASGVSPLSRGAGQCPPVSYFLMWRMMDEVARQMEGVFKEIIENIGGRQGADGSRNLPLDSVNYNIISGLAGGTGRGCWELVAFKVREVCTKRFGAAPKPVAILFDASVTSSCSNEEQFRIATRANAMTAFSQLAVWESIAEDLRNTRRIPHELEYRLPSMQSPANRQADVLALSFDPAEGAGAGQKPPVDQVYLIFENSRMAVLANNNQYYDMAGRGLYAKLKFFEIGSKAINSSTFYNSFGAAAFEVPATELRQYFEGRSRIEFLQSLSEIDETLVNHALQDFFTTLRFDHGFSAASAKGFLPVGKENEFSLWQKIAKELQDRKAEQWAGVEQNLRENSGDLDFCLDELKRFLATSEQDVAGAVASVFGRLDSFSEFFEKQMNVLYYRGQEKATAVARSLGSIVEFCSRIDAILNDRSNGLLTTSLPAKVGYPLDDPGKLFDAFKGREVGGLIGRRFNDTEIQKLKDASMQFLLLAAYPHLREAYVKGAQTYLSGLSVVRANAPILLERARRICDKEMNAMSESLKVTDFAKVHNRVFTDPMHPGGEDHESDSRDRFVRRIMRPVLSEGEAIAICKDASNVLLDRKDEIDVLLYNNLFSAPQSIEAGKIELGEKIELQVRDSISLKPEFIARRFSLEETVKSLRDAWTEYFRKLAGQSDKYQHAVAAFESVFGCKPKRDADEISLGSIEQLLQHMSASLAASTAAYWELENHGEHKVFLFFPHFDFDIKAEKLESEIKHALPSGSVVEIVKGTKDNSNPFVLVAYHVEDCKAGPQGIRSMQYWNSQGVYEQLKLCERPGSENAIFHPAPGMQGVTFSDPIYIANDAFVARRWRPWVSEEEKKAAAVGDVRVNQALLYLFLSPDGEYAQISSEAQWSMPLAEFKSAGVVRFLRGGLEWDNKKCRTDNLSYIQAGKEISRSRGGISGVKAWLASPEGADVLESILKERAHFWQMLEEHGNLTRKLAKHYDAICLGLESSLVSLRQAGETNNEEDDDRILRELIQIAKGRDQSLI